MTAAIRRVISGIMYMPRCGGRWKDCPTAYGPYTTIYNRWNRWSSQGVWERIFYALTGSTGVFTGSVDSTHIKAHRSAAGEKRGHVFTPLAPRAADARPKSTRRATMPVDLSPSSSRPAMSTTLRRRGVARHSLSQLADRAYDAASLRNWLAERGMEPIIPPNPTRKNPHAYDRDAYRGRNLIDRMFCRPKDFRHIATRYDKRADIFLSAVCLAATVTWWAN